MQWFPIVVTFVYSVLHGLVERSEKGPEQCAGGLPELQGISGNLEKTVH